MFDGQRDSDGGILPVRRRLRLRKKAGDERDRRKQEYSPPPVKKRLKKVQSEKRKQEYSPPPVKKRLKKVQSVQSEKRKHEYSQSPVRKRLRVEGVKQPLRDDASAEIHLRRPGIIRSPSVQHPHSIVLGEEGGGLKRAANSDAAYLSSRNMGLQSEASTSGSVPHLQHKSLPPPPAQAALHTSPASTRVRGVFSCRSCPNRFPSYESLEYHQNLKTRALRKCKIPVKRFTTDLHLAVCPVRTCCYSSNKVGDMEEHLTKRHRQAGKQYLAGEGGSIRDLYVILKHSPSERGVISCPACQRHFMSRYSLERHQDEACRGYGQHCCVICAAYFRDRRQMMNHMTTAHPPPPGVTITGMFMGGRRNRELVQKTYRERSERSINASVVDTLAQFTFIPELPVVTSASEFFTPSTSAGLTWLIQRARSLSGNSILRLNASTLIRKGSSKVLLLFDTQAELITFPASESPDVVSRR